MNRDIRDVETENWPELKKHDELTGLPNHYHFRQILTEAIKEASTAQRKLGVFLIDIDRFKYINNSFGHATGDRLLKRIAEKLKGMASSMGAVCARMGGDEFLMMFPLNHWEEVHIIGEKIIRAFNDAISVKGVHFHITPSIGISLFPDHGKDAVTLIKHADVAMYRAKLQRNHYKIFEPSMNQQVLEQFCLEHNLRKAVNEKALQLHYQPQINIRNNRCIGVEALLRWHHPTKGWISPATFIPLAEETGLIIEIERWTLLEACKQMRHWQKQGSDIGRMSVNISNKMFHSGLLISTVKSVLEETQLDPSCLELEITESVTRHEEATVRVLGALKKIGVGISIDDFGTGYSSLGNLIHLPFDRLKIDQSFIRAIKPETKEASIVATIISLAKSLDVGVIAEGVETEEELAFLYGQHCYEVQGYYFSKPLPANKLEEFLKRNGFIHTNVREEVE